jgi:uncharacterized membrane protein YhaH (DUF805 family)
MSVSLLFAIGLLCTLAVSGAVVGYIRQPLRRLLVELCGNAERAEFWTAFSAITIGLVPLIFALGYTPSLAAGAAAVMEVGNQLRWALIGMVASVLALGWIVGRFIPRTPRNTN